MCLGVPGKVISVGEEDGVLMGKVDFGGVARQVCLDHVRDVVPGEYVLAHVGFALNKLEAQRVFALLAELGQLPSEDEVSPEGEEGWRGGGASASPSEEDVTPEPLS